MNAIKSLVLSVFFSISAYAQTPAPSAWISTDANRVRVARAEALATGKKVMVHMGAAWCAPCVSAERFLAANALILQPALSKYVEVHTEELHQELYNFSDLFSHANFDYPNIILIDPVTGREDSLELNARSTVTVLARLESFSAGEDLAIKYQNIVRQFVAAGTPLSSSEVAYEALQQAITSTALNKTAIEYAAFAAELRQAALTSPALFAFDPDWGLEQFLLRIYMVAASRANFDLSAVQAIDPLAFTNLNQGSNVFYGSIYFFQVQLEKISRTQGLAAAAQACDGLQVTANAHYSGGDYYDYGANITTAREITCIQLAFGAGLLNKVDALARYNAIPEASRLLARKSSMSLYVMLDMYNEAIDMLEKARTRLLQSYTNPVLVGRINEAFDARRKAYEAHVSHPSMLP